MARAKKEPEDKKQPATNATDVYLDVVEEVLQSVRDDSQKEGADESVFMALKQLWRSNIIQSGAIEEPRVQRGAVPAIPTAACTSPERTVQDRSVDSDEGTNDDYLHLVEDALLSIGDDSGDDFRKEEGDLVEFREIEGARMQRGVSSITTACNLSERTVQDRSVPNEATDSDRIQRMHLNVPENRRPTQAAGLPAVTKARSSSKRLQSDYSVPNEATDDDYQTHRMHPLVPKKRRLPTQGGMPEITKVRNSSKRTVQNHIVPYSATNKSYGIQRTYPKNYRSLAVRPQILQDCSVSNQGNT